MSQADEKLSYEMEENIYKPHSWQRTWPKNMQTTLETQQ